MTTRTSLALTGNACAFLTATRTFMICRAIDPAL
jgi:hypothetical protein